MNVAAHQEEKNEETKTGKREAGKERRQTTDFKAACCLAAVVQGQHGKKMVCVRGNWYPWKGQQPFRPKLNGVGDRTTTLRRLLIGADASTLPLLLDKKQLNRLLFNMSNGNKKLLNSRTIAFLYLKVRMLTYDINKML